MAGILSTHVLDLAAGIPAVGMKIELWRLGDEPKLLVTVVTNSDGRANEPLLDADGLAVGAYEMIFFVKDYFASNKVECNFLDRVPVRFTIASSSASYHVPLLVTPWSYNTYRGS